MLIGMVLLSCWSSVLIYAQTKPLRPHLQRIYRLYNEALIQFNKDNPTQQSDSLALSNFRRVINQLPPNKANANIVMGSYLNAGILTQTYNRQAQSIQYYQKAISIGHRFQLADSLLFRPYLYIGTAYYTLQSIDSATSYYKKAEQIYLRYPQLEEARRLYNSFGAIYYEAGNYQQSINYFQKALQLNEQQSVNNTDMQSRYTSNIASALRHLEQYESAAALYKKLLPLNINRNELLINLGATYLEKNDPTRALQYLLQIKKADGLYAVRYENALARAYIEQGHFAKAIDHLNRALTIYQKQVPSNQAFKKRKNIGLTYKLLGDIATKRKLYDEGLQYYQQAIIQLDNDFNDRAIERNPAHFVEGFNSFMLFEAISAKAQCLEKTFQVSPSEADIKRATNTYRSALMLADHIQKVFDTEEARLFALKKIVPVHQRAVALLIRLYEITRQKSYLEEAFRRCEQSKAAVLYIGRKENESKTNTGIPDSLLQRERNLRFKLSQLFLRVDRAITDKELNRLKSNIRDTKLALSRLADRLHDYPEYYRKKFGADTIDLNLLQQTVLNRRTTLLSFYQTEETIYTFVLTPKDLHYYQTPNNASLRVQLNTLVNTLRTALPGEPYAGYRQAQYLYKQLIAPLEPDLTNTNSLIIIPHNELSQLSFDVLEDNKRRYLLERFDITYQYSASFLRVETKLKLLPEQMLAVAPFNRVGLDGSLGILPASEQEVGDLKGAKLTNRDATKDRFLLLAKQASVIHLATHAIANNDSPTQSYIAFAPQANNENKLYAHELQYGVLEKVKLIFLSACETASGKMVRGEGVMSLSRALSYAGCPNLITSLWKAEDNATAYISRQFYVHLDEGNSISRSLQMAKLDLLHDTQYSQFHSPQYWSHLVFVGSPAEQSPVIWPWLLSFLLGISGVWLITRKIGQKKITVTLQ